MSIERKAISALKWATFAKFVVQTASWAGTLIVVRLLTPDDYGLMAKVGVVCAIAAAIAELGLEAAIVRTAQISRDDLRKLYGLSLLFSLAMTATVAAASPLLARLFHEPRLTWPIVGASLQIIVASVALVPSAVWTRELAFRNLSKIEMVSGITSMAATLLLALFGAGVWALVFGTLFGAVVRSSALLIYGERVRPLFSFRGVGEHLKFGLTLVANRVNYFIIVQSDVMIGSGFLSTTQIGQYAIALQLATLPSSKVMGTVNQIVLPVVARRQDDLPRVRAAVLKAVGLMALIAFPVLWGISAVAPEMVRVLLGQKWLPAVPALIILPLIVPMRMINGILLTTSLALGNRRLDLRNAIINIVVLPSGFYIGAHFGLIGLCLAWLIAVPIAHSFTVPAVVRFIGIRARELLAECAAPAIAGLLMYAAVSALRVALGGLSPAPLLIALSLAGALVYIGVMMLISQRHVRAARDFMRILTARQSTDAD